MRFATFMAIALLALACSQDPSSLGSMNTTEISVTDDFFTPAADTVTVGQNITWQFGSLNTHTHNVTWDTGPVMPANSGDKNPAGTYVMFFSQTGTYTYHCTYHGTISGSGMAGSLVVQ